MIRARRRAPRAAAAAVLALLAALGSCAPPPPAAPLDSGVLRARYFDQLVARERLAGSLAAEIALHPVLAGRHLPGVLATLSLAAPDRSRLRVFSPGGTLADAVGRAGVVRVWLPSSRQRADVTECADSVGLGDLPELVVRSFAALWRPADGESLSAAGAGSDRSFGWTERGRAIRVAVANSGLPDTVTLAVPNGRVSIVYADWMEVEGAQLARQIRVSHDSAEVHLRCDVSRVHVRAAPDSSEFSDPGPHQLAIERRCDLSRLLGVEKKP